MARLLFLLVILLTCSIYCEVQAQQTIFVPVCVGNATLDTAKFTAIKTTVGTTNLTTIKLPWKADTTKRCTVNNLTLTPNIILDNTDGSGIFVVAGQTLTVQGPRVNPAGKTMFYGTGTVSLSGGVYINTRDSAGETLTLKSLVLTNGCIGCGGSVPGGNSGEVQYNNSGIFSGATGLTFTAGNLGQLNPTQGTITTNKPFLNHSATWNSGTITFNNITSNVTVLGAASASTLINLQKNSVNQFAVDLNGRGTFKGPISIAGLSSTATMPQNFTGFVTFASAGTAAVTFATAEPDANYLVFFDCGVNQTVYATAKLATGFTANSSNATSTATCGWVLVRSPAAPVPTRVLTINSVNPASAVAITVSPTDNSGNGNGSTSFTRTYNDGTVASLIAPATSGGNTFSKWQKDSVDYATTLSTTVTMDAAHTMTAVFGTPAPTPTDVVYVSFFQNDSTTTLPNADTGQVTTVLGTVTFGTHQYQARNVNALATDTGNGAVWDAAVADGLAEIRVLRNGPTQGFILRATDVNNYIYARVWDNQYRIVKVVAGVSTTIATGAFSGFVNDGDYLRASLSGSTITITLRSPVNNTVVSIVTVTETFNQTATKHGVYIDNLQVRLKHFSFSNATSTADWILVKKPQDYQIRQRDSSNLADIPISGNYSGTPTAIEARWNGAAWQTITTNPAGGTFSGTLTAQAAGQGLLEVRFVNNVNVLDRRRYVGIGDVFVVAGQSNAEGRISSPQFYSHATLRVGVFGNTQDCQASPNSCRWREAYDPTDDSSTGIDSGGRPQSGQGSPWPLVATKVMVQTGFPVAFITAGHGQTGFFGDGGTWMPPNGVTYLEARHSIEAANPGGLKGILWYQGESDSRGEPGTQATYENALKSLRSSLSNDLGFGALKMFVAQLSTLQATGITRSTLDLVRIAQTNVVDSGTDTNMFVGPILYDLDTCTGGLADCVHVSTPAHAQKEADRWWHMIKNVIYSGAEGRGPTFSSLSRISATQMDVTFTLSGTAILMAAAPPTVGWRINDGTTCTVTAAVRQSNTSVRLTVSGCTVTSGVTTLSWSSFNDATGQVLTDNTTDAMPAEPFVNKLVP